MTARTLIFNVAAAGSVPTYLAGMSSWQVRNLTPSQGQPEARYAWPTKWRDSTLIFSGASVPGPYDTDFYNSKVFLNQSGAVHDPTRTRVIFHGGGHAATCNNSIVYFDYSGDAAPVGWKFESGSDTPEANINYPPTGSSPYIPFSGPNSDGVGGNATWPISVHTYAQMVFVPSRNRLYRFGGACFGAGTAQGTSGFYYDFNTALWSEMPVMRTFNTQAGAWAQLSPDETKVFVWNPYGTGHYFVTLADAAADHTLTTASGSPGQAQYQPCGARNLDFPSEYLVIGGGYESGAAPLLARTETINWSSNSVSTVNATLSGPDLATFSAFGAGMFYDQGNHCFWMFANKGAIYSTGSNVLNHMWKITRNSASSYTVQKVTLPTPITMYPVAGTSGDSFFTKFLWREDWRTMFWFTHTYLPVQALRIP